MVYQSWIVGNDVVRGILVLFESFLGIGIIYYINKYVTKDLGDDE